MIPGVEHVFLYLWQEWIRHGRTPDAAWNGTRRVLRPTRRYRRSVGFMFLLMSWLVYLLVGFVSRYPDELALLVLLVAASLVWVLAAGGTANASLEQVSFDHVGLHRRSLFKTQVLAWEALESFRYPAGQDVVLAGLNREELRIGAVLDGLGTLLTEIERRVGYLPAELQKRLGVESKTPNAPLISR